MISVFESQTPLFDLSRRSLHIRGDNFKPGKWRGLSRLFTGDLRRNLVALSSTGLLVCIW
jgi:hypothetical protein